MNSNILERVRNLLGRLTDRFNEATDHIANDRYRGQFVHTLKQGNGHIGVTDQFSGDFIDRHGRDGEDASPSSPPRLIDRSVPGERYYQQDSARPRHYITSEGFYAEPKNFHAEGFVNPHGELCIEIETKLEDGQRSTVLRGAEQFQSILKYFDGKFTSIRGSWVYGTNLARFNKLTAQGMSPVDAAAGTWTGGQAAEAGFRTVRILNSIGSPGKYEFVEVLFTKDSS